MGRSVKKGPFVDSKLLKKVLKQRDTGVRDPIRTWSRGCIIIPEFVAHTFMVHNGNEHFRQNGNNLMKSGQIKSLNSVRLQIFKFVPDSIIHTELASCEFPEMDFSMIEFSKFGYMATCLLG